MQPFLGPSLSDEAMTHLLQDYWMRGDPAINSLFYVDNRRRLVLNPLAQYKVELLSEYYSSLAGLDDPSLYYPYLVCSWLGIDLWGPQVPP